VTAKAFILPAPWAHLDPKADKEGFGRKALSPDHVTEVDAGVPIYLAVSSGDDVRVTGQKMGAHLLGEQYKLGVSAYNIWLMSVGVGPSEERLEVEVGGNLAGTIHFNGHIPRPAFSARDENTSTPSQKAEYLDEFLLSIIDLIKMANDPQYQDQQIVWDRLFTAWTDQTAESTVPPMALIVRHAQKMQKVTQNLFEKPRHILRRLRELIPVDRVQQLDISCVRWLSRQPGTDVYERAGPRQRILAVQRHQSVDTLENRVFVDFAKRTKLSASKYSKRYEKLKKSERWILVDFYGRRSHRMGHELRAAGVSTIQHPVVPNFVLLQDIRYRRLWKAYLELLRQSDDEDECWRWQHRLWLDYALLLVHLSIRANNSFLALAEMPLRINEEQERGSWIAMSSQQSGSWLALSGTADESVVSLIWSLGSNHQKVQPWMHALGCQAIFHIQRLSDSREAYVALWTYHSFCNSRPDMKALGQSAKNAIENCQHNARLIDDIEVNLTGLIVVSDFQEPHRQRVYGTENGEVIVLKTGITHSSRKTVFSQLPKSLINHIQTIFVD